MNTDVDSLNKELVREMFSGISRADASLFYECLAEDATLTITGECSWSQVIRGREAIQQFYRYVHSQLAERGRTDALKILADDDWVVVEARGNMVMKGGSPYRNHYCLLFRLEAGRIVEMKEYQDTALVEKVFGAYPRK